VDAQLQKRLDFFESAGQVDPDLCTFVRAELDSLATDGVTVTEDSAGMFATHVLLALQRVRAGEPVEVPDAADLISAQLEGEDGAVARANEIASRASVHHNVQLPPHEVDFVALHVAALLASRADSGAGC
jgi:hypothetical protein